MSSSSWQPGADKPRRSKRIAEAQSKKLHGQVERTTGKVGQKVLKQIELRSDAISKAGPKPKATERPRAQASVAAKRTLRVTKQPLKKQQTRGERTSVNQVPSRHFRQPREQSFERAIADTRAWVQSTFATNPDNTLGVPKTRIAPQTVANSVHASVEPVEPERGLPRDTKYFSRAHQHTYVTPALYSSPDLLDVMDKSSSTADTNSSSHAVSGANTATDGKSTVKGPKRPKGKYERSRLEDRLIAFNELKDNKLEEIKSLLKFTLPRITHRDIVDISKAARDFLTGLKDAETSEELHQLVSKLYLDIDKGKTAIKYPIIPPQYFRNLIECCEGTNEAVLQRSLMMSTFHPYWLPDVIGWNNEEPWVEFAGCELPSSGEGYLPVPKPDLAFSFKKTAFTNLREWLQAPDKAFEACLAPDRGERYFPFLFLEVKRALASIQPGEMANLNSASRALYNMHKWMASAGMAAEFFADVRVFSFACNADEFSVRVHRAEWQRDNNQLAYYFAKMHMARYEQRPDTPEADICMLVGSILKDYGVEKLLPLLQKAYRTVCSLRFQPDNGQYLLDQPAQSGQRVDPSARQEPGANQAIRGSTGSQLLVRDNDDDDEDEDEDEHDENHVNAVNDFQQQAKEVAPRPSRRRKAEPTVPGYRKQLRTAHATSPSAGNSFVSRMEQTAINPPRRAVNEPKGRAGRKR